MKNEVLIPEVADYSNIIDIPEILISNIEKMQIGFILSSSESDKEDTYGITHAHDNYELQYIAENNVEVLVDNSRKLTLQKGDLLLLPPHMYHKTYGTAPDYKRYCVNFSILPTQNLSPDDNMQELSFREQVLSSLKQEIVFQNDDIQRFILKIFESNVENTTVTLKNKLYLNVIFEEIVTHLSEQGTYSYPETQVGDATHLMNMQRKWMIETYVSHYYMYRNHTENLSQVLGLSPRQASRVIKELMGCTLQELILTQKMVVAMEAIKFSDTSLIQISDMLGYSTYYGFYTAFCKYYGFSPEQSCK